MAPHLLVCIGDSQRSESVAAILQQMLPGPAPEMLPDQETFSSHSDAVLPAYSDAVLPDALSRQEAEDQIRHISLATQNALYRSILSAYASGLSDQGAMAKFALDNPDAATRALEAYQAQECLVIEMTQEFLLSNTDNTNALEREMERLLRMRGIKSRAATGVVDARGSRRRKR